MWARMGGVLVGFGCWCTLAAYATVGVDVACIYEMGSRIIYITALEQGRRIMTAPTARIPAMEAAAKEAVNEVEYAEVQLHRALQAIERCAAKAERHRQRLAATENAAGKRRAQAAAKTIREQLREAQAAKREAQSELKEAKEWIRQLEKLNYQVVTDYEERLAETRRRFMSSRHGPGRTGDKSTARGNTGGRGGVYQP